MSIKFCQYVVSVGLRHSNLQSLLPCRLSCRSLLDVESSMSLSWSASRSFSSWYRMELMFAWARRSRISASMDWRSALNIWSRDSFWWASYKDHACQISQITITICHSGLHLVIYLNHCSRVGNIRGQSCSYIIMTSLQLETIGNCVGTSVQRWLWYFVLGKS